MATMIKTKAIAGISKEQVDRESLWVVKFIGHRDVDTYPNLMKKYGEDFFSHDDVRDVSLLCYERQPESLKPFFQKLKELDDKYGWMTFPELFERFGEPMEVFA